MVPTAIPGDQTTFLLAAAPESSDDPLPYVAYEFMVGVANREGSVNSTYSQPDTVTPPGGNVALASDQVYVRIRLSCAFLRVQ